jgi:TetR/AcrR family transcriptional regulator, multidrug resistance operon repressor
MRTRDEQKELAIREKAIEIIVKEGLDGLSMHKLAKAAGVSPATIYIYFKDREDLIGQISMEEGRKMLNATLHGFDPAGSFAEGLRTQWINRANYFLENPLRLKFLELIRHSPSKEQTFKTDNAFTQAMHQFVHNAIERGELVELPIEVFWSVAYAPLYQLIKFHFSPTTMPRSKGFELNELVMEQTLQLVIKALTP